MIKCLCLYNKEVWPSWYLTINSIWASPHPLLPGSHIWPNVGYKSIRVLFFGANRSFKPHKSLLAWEPATWPHTRNTVNFLSVASQLPFPAFSSHSGLAVEACSALCRNSHDISNEHFCIVSVCTCACFRRLWQLSQILSEGPSLSLWVAATNGTVSGPSRQWQSLLAGFLLLLGLASWLCCLPMGKALNGAVCSMPHSLSSTEPLLHV